jgi:hypothetical protein
MKGCEVRIRGKRKDPERGVMIESSPTTSEGNGIMGWKGRERVRE